MSNIIDSVTVSGVTSTLQDTATLNKLGGLTLTSMTQNAYDSLQDKDANTVYFITES